MFFFDVEHVLLKLSHSLCILGCLYSYIWFFCLLLWFSELNNFMSFTIKNFRLKAQVEIHSKICVEMIIRAWIQLVTNIYYVSHSHVLFDGFSLFVDGFYEASPIQMYNRIFCLHCFLGYGICHCFRYNASFICILMLCL